MGYIFGTSSLRFLLGYLRYSWPLTPALRLQAPAAPDRHHQFGDPEMVVVAVVAASFGNWVCWEMEIYGGACNCFPHLLRNCERAPVSQNLGRAIRETVELGGGCRVASFPGGRALEFAGARGSVAGCAFGAARRMWRIRAGGVRGLSFEALALIPLGDCSVRVVSPAQDDGLILACDVCACLRRL